MLNPERIKLIKEIKQALQQRVAETTLWNSLIKAENLTINGKTINSIDVGIKGLTFSDLINS
jgi:hypothetical protein